MFLPAPRASAVGIALGVGIVLSTPLVAEADVDRRGSCVRSSDWRLKASPDDGRIEVRAEVDSPRRGQVWRWRILHDGYTSAKGKARTRGGGSFRVERTMVDARGRDRIGWRAVNQKTGERCKGGLAI
jgi:hypothetical protein